MLNLNEIKAACEKADKHVCNLASGKEKFTMCVPPQPDDSDVQFVKIFREYAPALIAEVERLRETNARALELIKHGEESESGNLKKIDKLQYAVDSISDLMDEWAIAGNILHFKDLQDKLADMLFDYEEVSVSRDYRAKRNGLKESQNG